MTDISAKLKDGYIKFVFELFKLMYNFIFVIMCTGQIIFIFTMFDKLNMIAYCIINIFCLCLLICYANFFHIIKLFVEALLLSDTIFNEFGVNCEECGKELTQNDILFIFNRREHGTTCFTCYAEKETGINFKNEL